MFDKCGLKHATAKVNWTMLYTDVLVCGLSVSDLYV